VTRPLLALFVCVALVLGACSGDTPADSTASTSSTTTTIVGDTCERVADDAVTFIQDLLDELDRTRLVGFRERDDWSDDLVRLERLGADLDIRADVLRCDAAAIRRSVLERADLSSSGPLSEGLVEYLLDPPPSTSSSDEPAESTSTSGA
jgi:hypothetical protein